MKNQLEQFILNHLEELNREVPPSHVWTKLKAQLDEDELIDFIQKHREGLDGLEPASHLWQHIQEALEEQQLEGFLEDNKGNLDHLEPSKNIWANISAQLDEEQEANTVSDTKVVSFKKEPKMVPLRVVWQIAASFVLIIVSIFAIQYYTGQPTGNELAKQDQQLHLTPEQLSEIAPELAEAESYYTRVIHDKLNQLRNYKLDDAGVDIQTFEAEIKHLDSVYIELKSDLIESQRNEQVMGAMVENLQLRIEILNRQLLILEQIQQLKDGKTDEISI
ncbi:MAG: hypothetical protein ACPGJS_03945 [Flammeovirgaceae bacterium]